MNNTKQLGEQAAVKGQEIRNKVMENTPEGMGITTFKSGDTYLDRGMIGKLLNEGGLTTLMPGKLEDNSSLVKTPTILPRFQQLPPQLAEEQKAALRAEFGLGGTNSTTNLLQSPPSGKPKSPSVWSFLRGILSP